MVLAVLLYRKKLKVIWTINKSDRNKIESFTFEMWCWRKILGTSRRKHRCPTTFPIPTSKIAQIGYVWFRWVMRIITVHGPQNRITFWSGVAPLPIPLMGAFCDAVCLFVSNFVAIGSSLWKWSRKINKFGLRAIIFNDGCKRGPLLANILRFPGL